MFLACGPFVGDWKQEISTFRPYVRWLSNNINNEGVFISTHSNRSFLYDWLPEENIIPIYEGLSRDELLQSGYVNLGLNRRDYMMLLRGFKNKVSSNRPNKQVENFYLYYTKTNTPWYPIYNRTFEKVKVKDSIKIDDKKYIVFIADSIEKPEKLEEIYKEISKIYNIVVIGDMKTHLLDKNIILKNPDYFENGYRYIMQYITKAEAVVCPISHWTLISNMQEIPVFSWGECISQYSLGGIYNFGNKKINLIPNSSSEVIIGSFKHFIERCKLWRK